MTYRDGCVEDGGGDSDIEHVETGLQLEGDV
jgi:hypothetical protein